MATVGELGALIARYRKRQDWTQETLANLVGVDRTLIVRWEKGERVPTAEFAAKLDRLLPFDPQHRKVFYEATPLGGIVPATADYLIEQDIYRQLEDELHQEGLDRLLVRADYISQWALARVAHLRCNTKRAVPLMQKAVNLAMADVTGEFLGMILLDMADAYGLAGNLKDAEHYAIQARQVADAALREERGGLARSATIQRLQMGVARTIVLLQEIACLQGNWELCLALHHEAHGLLTDANDPYGLAKSFYFLALFQFYLGNLPSAREYGDKAYAHAKAINAIDEARGIDPWWWIRDGLFLGAHWWRLHTVVLLFDIVIWTDPTEAAEYLHIYHAARNRAVWWVQEFPPFHPRYAWVAEAPQSTFAEVETTLKDWSGKARKLGHALYLPDILICQGDFLQRTKRSRQAVEQAFLEARDEAQRYELGLLVDVANARLDRL